MIGRPVYSYTVGSFACWVVAVDTVSLVAPTLECDVGVSSVMDVVNWRM